MKAFLFSCLCIFFTVNLMAQNDLSIYGFGNVSLVTISDDYGDSVTDAITADDNIKINPNGVGYGVDGYAIYNRIFAGGGFHYHKIKGSEADEATFTGTDMFVRVGYNLSRDSELLIMPAVRAGVLTGRLDIPFNENAPTSFGDYQISESSNTFTGGSFFYGVEVGVSKIFGSGGTGGSVGIYAWVNFASGDLDWTADSLVRVKDIDLASYNYYGVTLKFGGGWSNMSSF